MKIKLTLVLLLMSAQVFGEGPSTTNSVLTFRQALSVSSQPSSSWEQLSDYSEAVGYIRGVDVGLYYTMPCYRGITNEVNEQLAQAWIKHANGNPELWSERNAIPMLTITMLLKLFPPECPSPDGTLEGGF